MSDPHQSKDGSPDELEAATARATPRSYFRKSEALVHLLLSILVVFVGFTLSLVHGSQQDLRADFKTANNELQNGFGNLREEFSTHKADFSTHKTEMRNYVESLRTLLEDTKIGLNEGQGSLHKTLGARLTDTESTMANGFLVLNTKVGELESATSGMNKDFRLLSSFVESNFRLVNQIFIADIGGEPETAEGIRKVLQDSIQFVATKRSDPRISLYLRNDLEIDFQSYLEEAHGIRLADSMDPDWSNLNNCLIFVSRGLEDSPKATHDLFVYDFISSRLAQLTDLDHDVRYPRWSPAVEGSVLYSRERKPGAVGEDGKYDLYTGKYVPPEWTTGNMLAVNILQQIRRITTEQDSLSVAHGTWAPDGKWVLFAAGQSADEFELSYRRSDGEGPLYSVPGTKGEYKCSTDWFADQIVYTRSDVVVLQAVELHDSGPVFGHFEKLHESDASVVCPSIYSTNQILYSVASEDEFSQVSIWNLDGDGDSRMKSSRSLATSSRHSYFSPRPIRLVSAN